jgi:hypothetical protein
MLLQTKIFDLEAVTSIQEAFTKLNTSDKRLGLEKLIRCYYRRVQLYKDVNTFGQSLEKEFEMTRIILQLNDHSFVEYDKLCSLWLNKLYLIDKLKGCMD